MQTGRFITTLTLFLALGSAALMLAGCVTTGGIAPHARQVDTAELVHVAAPPVDVSDTWWKAYGDEQLDALVDRALVANPGLATVRLRIERAEASVQAADAARQPEVDADVSARREHFSDNAAQSPVVAGRTVNSGSLFLDGSWEVDVFGRERSALDAAVGSRNAAQADFEAARILLSSNIVRQYVQLARLADQRAVYERSRAQRNEILALTQQRVAAGLDTAVELRQSEGAVPEIDTAIAAIDEQSALARHALAELTGQGPDALDGITPRLGQVQVVALPRAVPADLLGRRADITAAKWRVEAATKDLQSAHAEFYPSVNLLAFAGFTSIGLNNLTESGSRQLGIGPAIHLPIFDAGRLRAHYRAKATDVDSAVEGYNSAVLYALRDASDALASVQYIARQREAQEIALDRAERAYDLAVQRYRAGVGSYLTVLTAETNVLAQRRNDNDLKARALDAQALLARSLGGGYTAA